MRWLALAAVAFASAATAVVVFSSDSSESFDPNSNTEVSKRQFKDLRKGMARAEVERRIGRGGRVDGERERYAEPRLADCFYYTGLGGTEAVQVCYRSDGVVRLKWDALNLREKESNSGYSLD
jgi:hypothetical protein